MYFMKSIKENQSAFVRSQVEEQEGLSWCSTCGGAEGSLPTECPGRKMSIAEEQRVYAKYLDFLSGRWVVTARRGQVIRMTALARPGLRDGVDPLVDPLAWAERCSPR